MDNKIICLVGFSASGKDTLANMISERLGYEFIVSTTTRPMRNGESDRKPYNFVTNEVFDDLIKTDSLVEYRDYKTNVNNVQATWYYGVEKSEVSKDKNYVVVLDLIGLEGFKEYFGDCVTSFFLECTSAVRKERCIARGDYDEYEFGRRLADDMERFPIDRIKN